MKLVAPTALLVLVVAGTAWAQDFSADLASRTAQVAQPAQKIFVSGSRIRVETGDASGSILITDGSAGTAVMVMPRQQVYIETRNAMAIDMARLFHPTDPEDPCSEWLKMMQDRGPGATCRRVGEDTVDGRRTIKFEGVSPEHERGYAWVDPSLRFIIKVEGANGDGMALENIREAPQPPALFTIPAGFRRVDPQQPTPAR